ncbi:MAG: YggT family protein [Nitriliruptor sp.]
MAAGYNVATATFLALSDLVFLYTLVMLAYVIFSWVPRPPEPLVPIRVGSAALVDPLLAPLRRIIPPLRLGGIALDLSIILLFIAASLSRNVLARLAAAAAG